MNTYHMPEDHCPKCGKKMDAASGGSDAPKKGDVTICVGCAAILIFGDKLKLREPDEFELWELERSPDWPKVQGHREFVQKAKRE